MRSRTNPVCNSFLSTSASCLSIHFRCFAPLTSSSGKLFSLSRFWARSKTCRVFIRELLYADDAAFVAHSIADAQVLCKKAIKFKLLGILVWNLCIFHCSHGGTFGAILSKIWDGTHGTFFKIGWVGMERPHEITLTELLDVPNRHYHSSSTLSVH